MENLKKVILIIGIVSLIPAIGILVGIMVSNGYEKQYEEAMIQIFKEKKGVDLNENQQALEQIKLKVICSDNNLDPALSPICSKF